MHPADLCRVDPTFRRAEGGRRLAALAARPVEGRDNAAKFNVKALGEPKPRLQRAFRMARFELDDAAPANTRTLRKLLKGEVTLAAQAGEEEAQFFEIRASCFRIVHHPSSRVELGECHSGAIRSIGRKYAHLGAGIFLPGREEDCWGMR